MATAKKFYLVYREDNFEGHIDDNAFICSTYDTARELFDCMVGEYLQNYDGSVSYDVYGVLERNSNGFDAARAIFDSIESMDENFHVTKDDKGIRYVMVRDITTDTYCRVWMDEEPRAVITTKNKLNTVNW